MAPTANPAAMESMPISSVGKNRRTRGITLIEMLVVVTIIALISAVVVPSVAAGIESVRLRTASDSIAGFLNAAVNRAERRQQAVVVTISIRENRLTVFSSEPGFTRELLMPSGITIEAVLPPPAERSDDEEGRRLLLLPGAAIPAIGVRIANQRGSRRVIHLDPMTGFPHSEAVGAEE
jgi:prepilin-type N-terminal cleavage/methylation domain-containing protein